MRDEASAGAVDLPRGRVMPQLGRRRHRVLTGASGVLLFACVLSPARPVFWQAHVYGLVLAMAAASTSVRGMQRSIGALRGLALAVVVAAGAVAVTSAAIGLVELGLGAILLAMIGWRGASERRAALTALLVGSTALLWFGLVASVASAPGDIAGARVAMAAAGGLVAGGLVWLGEASGPGI